MGGKAFDRPAARLDNAQFSRLESYCHRKLRPFFRDILTNRHLRGKETHGDIDLLCAWDGVDIGTYIRGQDRGRVVEQGDSAARLPTSEEEQASSVERLVDNTQFTAWIERIARGLKAEEWARMGTEVPILAFKLPFAAWDDMGRESDAGGAPSCSEASPDHKSLPREEGDGKDPDPTFYQVDLVLIPPAALPYSHFIFSYGQTLIILFSAIRSLAPSLTLGATHLEIVQSAYANVPRVRVFLTLKVGELCEWLGLDLGAWQGGFDDLQRYYKWLATPIPGSTLHQAWSVVMRYRPSGPKVSGQAKRRRQVWDEFQVWLATSEESPWAGRGGVGGDGGEFGTSVLGERVREPQTFSDQSGDATKPGEPMPLDDTAKDALVRWGRQNEYDRAVLAAKCSALERWERRERRRRNREGERARELVRREKQVEHGGVSDVANVK